MSVKLSILESFHQVLTNFFIGLSGANFAVSGTRNEKDSY